MPFPDSPTGGLFLIQPAIRSPNFQSGLLGWTINQDGSAQFYNVVIIGNDLKVLGSNGSLVEIHSISNTARIDIQPGGGNVNPAILSGSNGPSSTPQLVILSPQQTLTTPNAQSSFILQGANAALPASFAGLNADSVQIEGVAGGVGGVAVLNLGNNPGSPAGVNLGVSGGSSIGMDGGGLSVANNITIATVAGTIDLIANAINLNLNGRAYLKTNDDVFPSTALLTLGAAAAPIAGCSHTYGANLVAGTKWAATLITDATNGAAAGVTTIGELTVSENGGAAATQTGQALWRAGAVINSGSMPAQQWVGTFAAGGSIAFQATGKCIGGGVNAFQAVHTTLRIQIFQ